ncbi:twin-arginine translocase TatA/TatE family subunit [Paenibacillus roseipurpureus]|uniref:Sec-independent protein translocase protein TatA n=1 Tax=Paenibacillus roseopurpureus TaxID=2918901 RepID=A0AA96RK51_9BACL|nr:twin-arginine translocase TatA/TatE family subunit [Paenibacillus sp. MBLB1832]WNR43896.1 twin-arginine translocase TatA/TatE family subunit [Paenibacillus sp. MBLB1832]
MFQNIGFTELLLIAVVALVLFGPQKLPEIGRVLGRTIRDFKKAANELMNEEPKPQAVKAPLAPDPVTPVEMAITSAAAQEVLKDEVPAASLEEVEAIKEVTAVEGIEQPTQLEPAGQIVVQKPAVSFVKNSSPVVIHVAGKELSTEDEETAAVKAVDSGVTQGAGQNRRLPD